MYRLPSTCTVHTYQPPSTRTVHEEGLDDGRGVREPGGLDHDRIELVPPLDQLVEDTDQIAAHWVRAELSMRSEG